MPPEKDECEVGHSETRSQPSFKDPIEPMDLANIRGSNSSMRTEAGQAPQVG
jgi:hypothetical protein